MVWQILLAVIVGFGISFISVCLGGYLVFKVKVPTEQLFRLYQPTGEAVNIDPFEPQEEEVDGAREVLSRIQKRHNERFRQQMEAENG